MPKKLNWTAEMRTIVDSLEADVINVERAHERADRLLCELLRTLRYRKVVELFESMRKYYS